MSDVPTVDEPVKSVSRRPPSEAPPAGDGGGTRPPGRPRESTRTLLVRIWLALSIAAPLFGSGYLLGYEHGRRLRPDPPRTVLALKSPARTPLPPANSAPPPAPAANRLQGTVVNEAGQPLSQVSISFVGAPNVPAEKREAVGELGVTSGPVPRIPGDLHEAPSSRGTVQSDENGRFELERPTAPAHLLVARVGFVSEVVAVEPKDLSSLRIVLRPGGQVTGTVTDPEGAARVGVYLIARGEQGMSATAQSDSQGKYVLADVLGSLTVEAFVEGQAPQICKVNVQPQSSSVCDFTLRTDAAQPVIGPDPNLGTISGNVLDSLGRPVGLATVETDEGDATTVTNRDGEFMLINVVPGALVIHAEEQSAGAGASKVVRARAGETLSDVRIYLPDRYQGSDDGEPEPTAPRASRAGRGEALEMRGDHVVVVGTLSEAPGLKPGDVLESIDDEPVLAVAQARGMLRYPADSTAVVKVRRDGTRQTIRFRRR